MTQGTCQNNMSFDDVGDMLCWHKWHVGNMSQTCHIRIFWQHVSRRHFQLRIAMTIPRLEPVPTAAPTAISNQKSNPSPANPPPMPNYSLETVSLSKSYTSKTASVWPCKPLNGTCWSSNVRSKSMPVNEMTLRPRPNSPTLSRHRIQ